MQQKTTEATIFMSKSILKHDETSFMASLRRAKIIKKAGKQKKDILNRPDVNRYCPPVSG